MYVAFLEARLLPAAQHPQRVAAALLAAAHLAAVVAVMEEVLPGGLRSEAELGFYSFFPQ